MASGITENRPAFPKRAVITGGMPYGNKSLHFGHIGGVFVPADFFARFLRDRYERRYRKTIEQGIAAGTFNVNSAKLASFAIIELASSVSVCTRAKAGVTRPRTSAGTCPLDHPNVRGSEYYAQPQETEVTRVE